MENNTFKKGPTGHLSPFFENGSKKHEPDKRYLVTSTDEIALGIKKIIESNELITVLIENTHEFLITALLGIDTDNKYIYIDDVKDPKKRNQILNSKSVTITSQTRGIKILFPAKVIEKTIYNNAFAIKLGFPDYLLKLQRREYFRATPPLDHKLQCHLNYSLGNIQIDIADISEGGINLVDRNNSLFIKQNSILKSCQITLPHLGSIESDLMVHRIIYPDINNKHQGKYIGCEFISPSSMATSLIRRYILKVERFSRSANKVFN